MSAKAGRAELERAMRSRRHVRVLRSARYADDIDGFVVAVGAKWALVTVTEDGGHPGGWTAVRVRDVDQARRIRSFQEAYARSLPSWPPTPPGLVDLDSTKGAITSPSAART